MKRSNGRAAVHCRPGCNWDSDSVVLDSRLSVQRAGLRRRRRQCLTCGSRLTTYEVPAERLAELEQIEAAATSFETKLTEMKKIEKAIRSFKKLA